MKFLLSLVTSKDGSLSQTKLAAACFHLALFCTAVWLTWRKGEWINEMWTMYFMAAVGHAAYDKTLANVRAYKDKQIEAAAGESMTTTTATTTIKTITYRRLCVSVSSSMTPSRSRITSTTGRPVAHAEGNYFADAETLKALNDNGQVALRYVDAINGAQEQIAGITNRAGNVLGLMPHPERYVSPLQHPAWTSQASLPDEGAGLQIFRNAVKHVSEAVGTGV